jgi:hypothetical protein
MTADSQALHDGGHLAAREADTAEAASSRLKMKGDAIGIGESSSSY